MKRILITWELGAGLGHLVRIRALAGELRCRGHDVAVALCDLSSAHKVMSGIDISLLQAPSKRGWNDAKFDQICTFAHILGNMCFSTPGELSSLLQAWATLYRYVAPDVLILDHSPTALLASRLSPAARMTIGTGFCIPPDEQPFRCMRRHPMHLAGGAQLLRDEELVLNTVNASLRGMSIRPLDRLGQLFGDVDGDILTTFAELDHFPDRRHPSYWGILSHNIGGRPRWPKVQGPRIFAYLKQFAGMPCLLRLLRQLGGPTVVVGDGLESSFEQRFGGANIHFERSPVDMSAAAQECDVALLNATHAATTAMLLAGKPVVLLPLVLEQDITAMRVERLGAGASVMTSDPAEIETALNAVLHLTAYRDSAQKFAARYSAWRAEESSAAMADYIEGVLSKRAKGARVTEPMKSE